MKTRDEESRELEACFFIIRDCIKDIKQLEITKRMPEMFFMEIAKITGNLAVDLGIEEPAYQEELRQDYADARNRKKFLAAAEGN